MISQRNIFILSFLLVLGTPLFSFAQNFTKIFYYTEGIKSFASFQKNAKNIEVVAPQVYSVDETGELTGGLSAEFLIIARTNRVKIMPLLVNSQFSQDTLHQILDNPTVQDKIITQMIVEAKEFDFIGWQFDFEQMTDEYRDKYSAFARRAYPKFKEAGLQFSVAVIAQYSLNPSDYPRNLWHRVIGAYDYRELGKNSDFLSIMSYDEVDSAGPVASLPWVKKVIRFAIGQVPAHKLSLGVPFYFWKWDQKTGKVVDIGGYGRIAELTNGNQAVKWGWDPELQVPFVDYFNSRKKYRAWYENAKSFSRKVDLASLYNLHGFSAWTLGLEDPGIYQYLRERAI
ncbi:MAG: glycosyl hydrolase family 18 protein [Candidatus Vogelbacteria bacterium]|nr:glycosyl hydrolase family 18 protein [Candidatus Vogelbacteria bacterium]